MNPGRPAPNSLIHPIPLGTAQGPRGNAETVTAPRAARSASHRSDAVWFAQMRGASEPGVG